MCKSDIPVDNGIVAHTADPLSVRDTLNDSGFGIFLRFTPLTFPMNGSRHGAAEVLNQSFPSPRRAIGQD